MNRARLALGAIILASLAFFFLYPREAERGAEHPARAPSPPPPGAPSRPRKAETEPSRSLFVAPADSTAAVGEMSFSGRVVSRGDGSGIGDADLTFARGEASHSITTGADGSFLFVPPEPGAYQLAAVTAKEFLPFAPAWGESPLMFTARAGRSIKSIVVQLQPEKLILGKLVDPEGAAVAGAAVRLLVPGDEDLSLVPLAAEHTSDAAGTFRFRAPVGTWVEVEQQGFDLARESLAPSAWDRGEMTIRLRRQSAPVQRLNIRGSVVTVAGVSVPSALVTAAPADRDPFGSDLDAWTARSDGGGSFDVRGLPPGRYTLLATSPGLVPGRAEAVAAGSTGVVLRLDEQGGSIAGRVTASSGAEAVPSFAVVLSRPRGRLEELAVGTRSFLDAEGRFAVGPLEAGFYLVRVVAHGYAASAPRSVEVTAGETSRADFLLSRGASLLGRVVSAETSAPIAGARVELEGQRIGEDLPLELESAVTTNEDGAFALAGIAGGDRAISVEAKGHDTRIVSGLRFEEGATVGPVEVRLTPLAAPDAEPKRELTGIGAALAPEGDVLVIGQVIEGGGAFEAGLLPGDRILAIDGQPVGDLDMNGAVQRIRGPEGSAVHLTVRRAGGGEQTIEVFRRKIRA